MEPGNDGPGLWSTETFPEEDAAAGVPFHCCSCFCFWVPFFFAKVSVSLFPPFASVGDLSPACHGNCFHLFWKKKTILVFGKGLFCHFIAVPV